MQPKDTPKPAGGKVSPLTLAGPIPAFIGYADLKNLVKQFRGRFYDERRFKLWVEQGIVPSYVEDGIHTAQAGVRRRVYRWEDADGDRGVKSWILSTLTKQQVAR